MQRSKGPPPSEFRNMTFSELEEFVNLSSVMIKDHDAQFMNQVHEINKIFAQVGNNDGKCKVINRKLNYIKHWQKLIDLNIAATDQLLQDFEGKLLSLEDGKPWDRLNKEEVDPQRAMVYPLTLQMNEMMNVLTKKYEDVIDCSLVQRKMCKKQKDEQGQKVAGILDNQLKQLEHLDIKIKKALENLHTNNEQMARTELSKAACCPCCSSARILKMRYD